MPQRTTAPADAPSGGSAALLEPESGDAPLRLDRRRSMRIPAAENCKILDRKSARYVPAETVNVSAGGALLRAPASRMFAPGDRVRIAIGSADAPVACKAEMPEGEIVRVVRSGGAHQRVAVAFDRAEAVAARLRSAA